MTASEFITDLASRGITLIADDGAVVIDGPAEALTEDVVAAVRERKEAVLAVLCQEGGGQEATGAAAVEFWNEGNPWDAGETWDATTPHCTRCGTAAGWTDGLERWRCLRCEPPVAAKRLIAQRERILARLRESFVAD